MGFAAPPRRAQRPAGRDPADDEDALAAALAAVDSARPAPGPARRRRRARPAATTAAAARRDGPGLALVSVPGQYAFAEAMDALEAGCDVMVFSDNVPVEQEIGSRNAARARPAGHGAGLRHGDRRRRRAGLRDNVVRPGTVGLVAASGTGAQQVMCLLDAAGVGVSAASASAAGTCPPRSAAARPARRSRRWTPIPATELIVVVSKPPAPRSPRPARHAAAWPRRCSSRSSGRASRTSPPPPRPRCRGSAAAPGVAAGRRRGTPRRRRAARPVRRRHAVRRGDGDRRRAARPHPLEHPAAPGVAPRRRDAPDAGT